MAIGDSFLDVMRLNQSNQQNRAALRLDQERLSLQQADLDLRRRNEERLQAAEAERVRDVTMDDLYTNGLALNLFDHKSLDLNKAAITEALDDPNHPNHGAVQMWLSKATNNSSLVKMPEGFGVTGFTRLQEGGPYQALVNTKR